jgi:hypothetical protein
MELTLGGGYSQFWKAIVRPPRDEYTLEDLGPKSFIVESIRFKRNDFELINKSGLTLQCSHWEPVDDYRP